MFYKNNRLFAAMDIEDDEKLIISDDIRMQLRFNSAPSINQKTLITPEASVLLLRRRFFDFPV